jgi:hypothetical protein
MKIIITISILLFLGISSQSQNYFKQGTDYLQNGNYYLADSFLTLHLEKIPGDRNARFNRAITKLHLNDSCSFCNDLYAINNPWEQDVEALDLYFEYCGKTDTIFYDKKWNISDRYEYRYYEVMEYHKCSDLINGKIHDIKLKSKISSLSIHQTELFKTDLFAFYYLDSNKNKIYTLTDSPPLFPGGIESFYTAIENSPYYAEALENLNIPNKLIKIQLLISKSGHTEILEIESISQDNDFMEALTDYIELIFSHIPNYKPAKLKGKEVDFRKREVISFSN